MSGARIQLAIDLPPGRIVNSLAALLDAGRRHRMWLAGNSVASATRLPFFHQPRVRFGTTYLYAT
jgi:hypothetical protein